MALRGFLKASGVNLADLIDLSTHRQLSKKPDTNVEPYTVAQIETLMAACDPYHRLVFTLLLSTGMRMQEGMNLTWEQIKWDTNQIIVRGERGYDAQGTTTVATQGHSQLVAALKVGREVCGTWSR
jgi:integrase